MRERVAPGGPDDDKGGYLHSSNNSTPDDKASDKEEDCCLGCHCSCHEHPCHHIGPEVPLLCFYQTRRWYERWVSFFVPRLARWRLLFGYARQEDCELPVVTTHNHYKNDSCQYTKIRIHIFVVSTIVPSSTKGAEETRPSIGWTLCMHAYTLYAYCEVHTYHIYHV
jgi:hypothetical protein